MFYIYGDSHSERPFRDLAIPHCKKQQPGITMFRTGRDNLIINHEHSFNNPENVFVLSYGEIDCRFHIGNQIKLGRNEDSIIRELVENYFKTIKNNILTFKQIIVVAVVPPVKQKEYEIANTDFPFSNSDEDRVRYTTKMNTLLEEHCAKNNFVYFDPYDFYKRPDGTLKFELSDGMVHIKDTAHYLEKFVQICK